MAKINMLKLRERLTETANRDLRAGNIAGAAIAVIQGGEMLYRENFGYSDIAIARTFYERLTVNNENYKYWYTEDVNSNFEYNLNYFFFFHFSSFFRKRKKKNETKRRKKDRGRF